MNAEVKYFAKSYFCKPVRTSNTSVLSKLLLQMSSQTVLLHRHCKLCCWKISLVCLFMLTR